MIEVSKELAQQMECCKKCEEIRSKKPFMSEVHQRDFTPEELALLHVLYH